MINLDIQPYCHGCPDFEPDVVKREIILADEFKSCRDGYDTTISCEKKRRCAGLIRFLEANQKFKDNDMKIYEIERSLHD